LWKDTFWCFTSALRGKVLSQTPLFGPTATPLVGCAAAEEASSPRAAQTPTNLRRGLRTAPEWVDFLGTSLPSASDFCSMDVLVEMIDSAVVAGCSCSL
jgi:hypothetical protein